MGKTRGQGEGSIFQEGDGSWRASLEVPGTDGKRHRKKMRGKTRKEVAAKLDAARKELAAGVVVDRRLTVAKFLDQWQQRRALSQDLAPATLTTYTDVIRFYIAPHVGGLLLVDLTASHVEQMTAAVIASGKSIRTANIARAVLRRALKDAMRDGLVMRNAAALSNPPRQPRREGRTLDLDQARALLAHVSGHPLEAAFVVSLTTGLRRGELLGLRWADIDLGAGYVTVRAQLRATPDGLRIVDTKNTGSVRMLPLSALAVDALHRHRITSPGLPSALVFTGASGLPVHPDSWRHHVYKATQAALGESWSPHELRHSCASIMLASGADLKTVSATLGHSSIRVTADVYAHLMRGDRTSADVMDQALGGSVR